MFLSLYDEVTNVLCLSFMSHNRHQYNSLILSKQTWAYPRQHLQQLLWCQGRWCGADIMKECLEINFHLFSMLLSKLCDHYANGFDNVKVSISFTGTLYNVSYFEYKHTDVISTISLLLFIHALIYLLST
jgi:hypothetical protein